MFFFREVGHSRSKGTSRVGRKGNGRGSGRDVVVEVDQVIAFLDLDRVSCGPLLIGAVASKMSLSSAFKATSSSVILLLFFIHGCFADCCRGIHLIIVLRRKPRVRGGRTWVVSLGAPAACGIGLQLLAIAVPGPVSDS